MRSCIGWPVVLGIASLVIGASGCDSRRVQAGPVRREAAPAAPEVLYVTVRSSSTPQVVELPGVVRAVRSVTLKAPAAGKVRAVAEEGTRLASGGAAAVLEATGLPAEVVTAHAALDAADRQRASARTAVSQAMREAAATVSTLEQTLRAAQAERDRRRAALTETQEQAETEPDRLRAQLQASEARLRRLRSGEREQRIRQLEAELQFMRSELKVAESQLQRKERLLAKGYISASELELARLGVERARANEAQHLQELSLQREGAHPEEIKEAEQQVEASRLAWRAARGLAQQVAQRRAELTAAEADVGKLQRELQNARANRLAIVRARQDAEASDAEVRRRQAEFTEARARLAQATVRAPFAGQVTRRHSRPGEAVTAGTALVDLVDPQRLRFEASASEAQVSRLRRGDRLEVTVPAAARRALMGRIAAVILASEPVKQTYTVQVLLESTSSLRPGMSGTGRIVLRSLPQSPRLPLTCLRRHFPRERRAEVLVLEGDRPVPRSVRLGSQIGSVVTVEDGLREGDRVIISELNGISPERSLRGREAPADGAAP